MQVALALCLLAAETAETHYRAGVELFEKGRTDEARERLKKAVELAPTARHWKALGVLEASQARYSDAEAAFRRACDLQPREADACYYLGRTLYALDRFDESLAVLEKVLPFDPQPGRVHLGIAQAQEALARPADAERNFRRAVALTTKFAPDLDPRLHFGIFLYRQGRLEEAAAQLQAAGPSPRARYHLGRVLLQQGRLEAAERQLLEAVKLDPAYAEAHLQLSALYRRLGRAADADRHARLGADQGSRTSR